MGLPAVLLVKAGASARAVGRDMTIGLASSMGQSLLVGIGREATYAGNRAGPNVRPPVETLLDLYNRDWIDVNALRQLAADQGIDFNPNPGNNAAERIWNIVKEASQYEIGIGETIALKRQGLISQDEYRRILTNNGVYFNAKVNLLEKVSDPIPAEMVIALYRQGSLPDEQSARYWLTAAGVTNAKVQDAYLQLSKPISARDGYYLLWRGLITEPEFNQLQEQEGIVQAEDKEQFRKSQEWSPSMSDLVSFAVREVWDKRVVERFGYDEEYDSIPEYQWWANVVTGGSIANPIQNAFNPFNATLPDGSRAIDVAQGSQVGDTLTWAKAFWRAHWQLMSPTQGYECLHRLRPDRLARYRELVPDVTQFTFAEMQLLLKTADYPKPMRDWLAAVSYRTITRVDLRRLYDLDVITQVDVYNYNLDYGYVPEDARRLTDWIVRDRDNRRNKKARASEQKRQLRLWKLGVLTDDELGKRLERLGLSQKEAAIEVATVKADHAEHKLATAQKNIRSLYVKWEIDQEQAKQRLRNLGMVENAVLMVMDEWRFEREGKGRHVTASQITRWVVRGVISTGSAVRRLTAMGYSRADAFRMVNVAKQDESVLAARAAKAAATSEKQRIRAAEAEVRAVEQQLAKLRQKLAIGGTPALLKRWLKAELISPSEVYRRLLALGWQPADANRFVQEETGSDAPGYVPSNLEQPQVPQ